MRLIIVQGPTAIGKTVRAIEIAQKEGTEIVSCDSRQFYRELKIGVARPSEEELKAAKHHFIASRTVEEPYNVYSYEQEALECLERLFRQHETVVAVGGSGLYVEALSKGIAVLPDPRPGLREALKEQLAQEGIESFQRELERLDPDYYAQVDKQNPVRLQRALEVCITSGKRYSQLIRQQERPRPFEVEKIVMRAPPEVLRGRIDRRVDQMMQDGLEAEAERLQRYRELMPLNTVGYKEFYEAWDNGRRDTEEIAEQIKTHTWQYAKKQITWLKKRG